MARLLIPFALLLVFTGCMNLDKRSRTQNATPERFDARERADREPRDTRIIQPKKTRQPSRPITPPDSNPQTEREIQWRPLRTDMEANRMHGHQPNPSIPSLSDVRSSPKRSTIPGSVYGPGSLTGITLDIDWQDMPAAMAYLDAFQRMKNQVPQIPYDSLRFDQAARLTDTVTLRNSAIQAADAFSFLDERSRCRTRFEGRTLIVKPYF